MDKRGSSSMPSKLIWRCVLLLVFTSAQIDDVNVSLPPPNFAYLTGNRDVAPMCKKIGTEMFEVCMEYDMFGEDLCYGWGVKAEVECKTSKGNCTYIAEATYSDCIFTLQQAIGNPAQRKKECIKSMRHFREYRCPVWSYAPLNETFCFTPDPISSLVRHYSEEARNCMEKCANYQNCVCRAWKPPKIGDYCWGETYRKDYLPPVWDRFSEAFVSPGNYSCRTLGQPPLACRHHRTEGHCRMYRGCEPDKCIIYDVSCPNRTQCEQWGKCDPKDGYCHYENKQDGFACDDGLGYTFDDQCNNGLCKGTINYCLKYNISCIPQSICLEGGSCNWRSGRCVYDKIADGTECNDGRIYTIEDRCSKGLCLGNIVNLCVERGVVCGVPNSCYDAGVCNPLTGTCSDATPADDERPCNDGNNQTVNASCIDGLCLGEPANAKYDFLTLAGEGECSDRDSRRMNRYSGDILEGEEGCVEACLQDVQCVAYSYAYPLCSVYGTARTRSPPKSKRQWAFELGTDPPAVAVELVKPPVQGQRPAICRKKGFVSDSLDADAKHDVSIDDWFSLPMLIYLALVMTCFFFISPFILCILAVCCPKKYADVEDFQEEPVPTRKIRKVKRKVKQKRSRRRKKKGADADDSDSDSDDDRSADDLRAIANKPVPAPDALAPLLPPPGEVNRIEDLPGVADQRMDDNALQ